MAANDFPVEMFSSKKVLHVILGILILLSFIVVTNPVPIEAEQTFAGPTNVPGIITTSVTWSEANSPYLINDNLTVTSTGTVHIDPGVSVLVDAWVNIYIDGKIYSNGTSAKHIVFSANRTLPWTINWYSIYIKSSGNSFKYTEFKNCSTPLFFEGTSGTPLVNNIVESCTVFSESGFMSMDYCNNNYFGNNSFRCVGEGSYGMFLSNSNNNRFYNSDVLDNYDDGIHLDNSSYNTFEKGTVTNIMYAQYGSIALLANSQFNTFYDFNVSQNYPQLIYVADSDNNTFDTLELFENISIDGIKISNSKKIMVKNTMINIDPQQETLGLYSNSHVTFQNNQFSNKSINYYDSQSKLQVQHHLTVKVLAQGTSQPVPDANVQVKDKFGTTVGTFKTDTNGLTAPIVVNDYIGNDTNANFKDTDAGERIIYNPHNITITEPTYYNTYVEPELEINKSQTCTVYARAIPIDYIKIQDAPGATGNPVNGKFFDAGSNHTLYASGYNNQLGYIKEVVADWSSNNTNIATVTPSGTTTDFRAGYQTPGQVKITATAGLKSDSADVTVSPAGIDYIRIQDAPSDTAAWIGDKSYSMGDTDTFFSNGYNNTFGYIGSVMANWLSSNILAGTVDSIGSMVMFSAASDNFGETYVEAEYMGLTNRTGTLTIMPPPIDNIIIRTMPNGTGVEVVDNTYKEGDGDTFYCAGYNSTFGFVMDVEAVWISSSIAVGTVTSPGISTAFKAVSKGTTQLTAEYGSISDTTGTLTVTGKNDIDLSVKIRTVPVSPILENTEIVIIVTVENLGADPVSDVIVHFIVNDVLESNDTISYIDPKGDEELLFPNSSASPDIYRLVAIADPNGAIDETDETNNRAESTVEVLTLEDFITDIEIDPASVNITADETITFTAVGIGKDSKRYNITPAWSVSGGGVIDTSGLFTANDVGVWEVYANFGSAKGTAPVIINPGEVKAIRLIPEKQVIKLGDSKQYTVLGLDSDNNEQVLDPALVEWYVNGTIGTISTEGIFKATAEGIGYVGANLKIGETVYNDEAEVEVKKYIVNEKKFESKTDKAEFKIIVGFIGDGNVTLVDLGEDDLSGENIGKDTFGDKFKHLGVFVKIEIPVEDEWVWLYIEIKYDPAQLPPGFDVTQLELFYFAPSTGTWVKAENTGVDTVRHVVYANVTHLTIFAPMAEAGGAPSDSDGDEDAGGFGTTMMIALALAAVVFVIAIAAGMIMIRKRRGPSEERPDDEREEELEEEEMVETELQEEEKVEWGDEGEDEIDLSLLEMITTKCPKCKAAIDIEPTFAQKVHLQCDECGKKGKMPNPYLKQIRELEKERDRVREEESEREKEPELVEIPCKGCGEPIEVPYSDSEPKVRVKCGSCGAAGKIKNPYLDIKKDAGGVPDKPKPPKRRRPQKEDDDAGIESEQDEDEEVVEKEERKEYDLSEFDDIDDDIDF